MDNLVQIIGGASGVGAGNQGCKDAPLKLIDSNKLKECGLKYKWVATHTLEEKVSGLDAIPAIVDISHKIATDVIASIKTELPFLMIGGDQSCSLGTWSGASDAIEAQGDLGLIWIDAHMDSHTPQTSPTNNVHGMPLAALMGHGDSRLTNIVNPRAKLKPENVILIGIRSFEAGEASLIEELGVKVYFMDEIEKRGIETVMQEARDRVTRDTYRFGIAVDIDGIDPIDAPACGTPEPGGIRAHALCDALKNICTDERYFGAEFVEYDPNKDPEGHSETVVVDVIQALFPRG